MSNQKQMKKAISYGREIDCYIGVLKSVPMNRGVLEKIDTATSILLPLTPIAAAVLASYATIHNNTPFWIVVGILVVAPSIMSTITKHKMKLVNNCRIVWIELTNLKENIFRLAVDGNLEGHIQRKIESKMLELKQAFREVIQIRSASTDIGESVTTNVIDFILEKEWGKQRSNSPRSNAGTRKIRQRKKSQAK